MAWLTEAQIQKFFSACKVHDNSDLTLIIKICLSTGCRSGNAANLKASQWSPDPDKIIFINTKGKKNRSVRIDNALYKELKKRKPFLCRLLSPVSSDYSPGRP